jgi:non-heme chloroperoxidase
MLFLGSQNFRVIAHDRRSHGGSDQTWDNNTMEQHVDDYAALLDQLNIRDSVLVGQSTGGGEVAHHIGKYGTGRVAKAVRVSAVPPLMVKTDSNPDGTPLEVFDTIRKNVTENRSQFYKDLALPFFGYNRPGAKVSEGVCESFWLQGMLGGVKGQYDCIREFSEVDYTEDLQKMTMPTLVIQGDDDQIVLLVASGKRSVEIAPKATLKIYSGAPHGLPITHQDQLSAGPFEIHSSVTCGFAHQ